MSTELLGEGGWPKGVDRIILPEVDSTNAEAARRAAVGREPAWIMTQRQTRGRGRRGRPWADPAGNFAATHLMFPDEPVEQVALNSFVASLSLLEALEVTAPAQGYALKWPNDVLLNGTKIAGILLETSGQGGKVDWLAVGIGVNLVHVPDLGAIEPRALPPSSLMAELGKAPPAKELLDILAINFAVNRNMMMEGGFDPIRRLWLRRAANLGSVITARTMRDELSGTFEDVDEEGNLVLATAKGRVKITAADVFF